MKPYFKEEKSISKPPECFDYQEGGFLWWKRKGCVLTGQCACFKELDMEGMFTSWDYLCTGNQRKAIATSGYLCEVNQRQVDVLSPVVVEEAVTTEAMGFVLKKKIKASPNGVHFTDKQWEQHKKKERNKGRIKSKRLLKALTTETILNKERI